MDDQDDEFKIFENPRFQRSSEEKQDKNDGLDGTEIIFERCFKRKRSDLGWRNYQDPHGKYYWHDVPPVGENLSSEKRDVGVPPTERELTNLFERYPVKALGYVELENCFIDNSTGPRFIQKCINDVNELTGSDPSLHVDTILRISGGYLRFYSTDNICLSSRPICSIRIWGIVGDKLVFAFRNSCLCVNHEPGITSIDTNSKFKKEYSKFNSISSNVLRCEVYYAGEFADSIDERMRIQMNFTNKILPKRSLSMNFPVSSAYLKSPLSHLFNFQRDFTISDEADDFPIPIDQTSKTLPAKYLGKTVVSKPIGVAVLNSAIDKVIFIKSLDPDAEDHNVLVHISPCTVCIESANVDSEGPDPPLTADATELDSYPYSGTQLEFRVRYISFLGISRDNVKFCGIIVQTDDKIFEAHVFECEPNSGLLCKTIEAACKLRFQKCLDAHQKRIATKSTRLIKSASTSDFASNLKNAFSRILRH